MTHVLIYFALIGILELILYLPYLWDHIRKPVACLVIILVAGMSGWLVSDHLSVWSVLVLVLSIYRVVNLLRVVEGRSPVDYMSSICLRTSLIIVGSQLILLLIAWHEQTGATAFSNWVDGLTIVDLLAGILLVLVSLRNILGIRASSITKHYTEQDLPTLTVAIPARNETEDLEACLNSLISSSYPKLEILVLDDCSQTKQTPGIIKDFAHAGVLFLAGQNPPEHWLAKNYAYQQLADEANGEIVLFCGVDTRFEVGSLDAMIKTMLSQKLSMLSVMPTNMLPDKLGPEAVIVQPLRYAWELALPRYWLNRPPVLSTCWLIKADLMKSSGGFKAITNSISVESYFAKIAAGKKAYNFLRSGKLLGLSSHKSVGEQRETAIRTRYPQTHRRPEIVAGLSLSELGLLVLPYVLMVHAALVHSWLIMSLAILNVIIIIFLYYVIVWVTYGGFIWRSLWLEPFAAIYDVCLLNYSMWRYEFSEVIWKDRNVCIPFIHYGPQGSA